MHYQPTLVARQFGLCQDSPVPFLNKGQDIAPCTSVEEVEQRIQNFEATQPSYVPTDFTPSNYCTAAYDHWWRSSYKEMACSKEDCFSRITATVQYPEVEEKKKQASKDVDEASKPKKQKVAKEDKPKKKQIPRPPAKKDVATSRKRKATTAASSAKQATATQSKTLSAGSQDEDPSGTKQPE